jgi:hypothetical protein
MQGTRLGNDCFSSFYHEQILPKLYVASIGLGDGAVIAPLLLLFSFRTEVNQNDRLTLIRVAGDHEMAIGRTLGNSHAHDVSNSRKTRLAARAVKHQRTRSSSLGLHS